MGVNFRSDGKRIITAATDSYRMALNYIDGEFSQNFNVTVPVRALQEAARIFKNDDDIIQIFVNKRKIQFVSDRTLIQSTLYDGTFPDIAAVIPKNFKSMMELDASMIIPVIERGILFKDDGVAELRMNLSEKEFRFILELQPSEMQISRSMKCSIREKNCEWQSMVNICFRR